MFDVLIFQWILIPQFSYLYIDAASDTVVAIMTFYYSATFVYRDSFQEQFIM